MGRHKKVGRKPLTDKVRKVNQAQSLSKWKKAHQKSFNLTLNIDLDKDIIEHLQKQENKQAYLKSLIRKDITK